jgi:glycosyltransferase involved in cell wall biosynthesis
MTRVDIGMPAYRRPQFIGEAIESVLAQTHTEWQLVVSENGPGGGEVEAVVQRYTHDPRVRYVATGQNLGAAVNWNNVLQAGDGPYFTLIQDDDTWEPTFLATRVAFLEEHPACGFVFSGERKIDQHGREIPVDEAPSLPKHDISEVLPQGVYAPREFLTAMYRYKLGGIHTPAMASTGVMSRRSALDAVGAYFDADYPFLCWDIELYTRMALRFPTGFLALQDGAQRLHHPSITTEENSFDGEHWMRFHAYNGEWFRRALPGFELPREYHEVYSEAYIMSALDALERGDRRKCAGYLRRALRHSPSALLNPRVAAAGGGLMLGRHGAQLLSRARAAKHRRNNPLINAPATGEAA